MNGKCHVSHFKLPLLQTGSTAGFLAQDYSALPPGQMQQSDLMTGLPLLLHKLGGPWQDGTCCVSEFSFREDPSWLSWLLETTLTLWLGADPPHGACVCFSQLHSLHQVACSLFKAGRQEDHRLILLPVRNLLARDVGPTEPVSAKHPPGPVHRGPREHEASIPLWSLS